MSTAAERMRLRRQRAREGKRVVPVEVDEDDVEQLEYARLLDRMAEHSSEDIRRAVQRLLKRLPLRIE